MQPLDEQSKKLFDGQTQAFHLVRSSASTAVLDATRALATSWQSTVDVWNKELKSNPIVQQTLLGKMLSKRSEVSQQAKHFILLFKKRLSQKCSTRLFDKLQTYCRAKALGLTIRSVYNALHCCQGKTLKPAKLCMHNEWNKVCKNKQTCGEIHSYCKIDANWCLGSSMLTDCRLFLVKCTKIRVGRKTATPVLP